MADCLCFTVKCGVYMEIDEVWRFAERSKRGERRVEWLELWDGVMGLVVECRELRERVVRAEAGDGCRVCAALREKRSWYQRARRARRRGEV